MDPWKHGKKVAIFGEGPDSEREEFPLPPLLSERDVKKPGITSFFMKSLVKNRTKKTHKDISERKR